jgi:poly(3-hydroxybutyrate) depolymerase
MKHIVCAVIALAAGAGAQPSADLFYVPKKHAARAPALIITSCTGATRADIDSNRAIADSLGWVLAACAGTKNHQSATLNDRYLMATYHSLISQHHIDTSRVFIYGFSGQGAQALMGVFLHPELFRGAAAVCAPAGALEPAQWEMLTGKGMYLISRQKDWNLAGNREMHRLFQANGIRDTLVVTKGKHEPKDRWELFRACQWLNEFAQ